MLSNITYTYYDEEEYEDFIKNIIRQFRKSIEYDIWINLYNRDTCAGTGLSKILDGVDIELHHYNITLWDWVEIILDYFSKDNLPFNSFIICIILTDLHLSKCIPCVPLSKDTHKQIHANPEQTIEKYPDILKNLHTGNLNLADELIKYHIKNYKKILNDEQRLMENE